MWAAPYQAIRNAPASLWRTDEERAVITGPNDQNTGKDQNKEYKRQSFQPLSRMAFGILISCRLPSQKM